LIADIKRIMANGYKIPIEKLDTDTSLVDYGFDSITIADFAKKISEHFSVQLTPAIFYNYSTINGLSEYFNTDHREHIGDFYCRPHTQKEYPDTKTIRYEKIKTARKTKNVLRPRKAARLSRLSRGSGLSEDDPIAIVGVAGRFPGARNADRLWDMLKKEESGITEIPSLRWDWRDYYTGPQGDGNQMSTNKGGFIDGIDEFDPSFFGIDSHEASIMDPAQRLLLLEAYHAIEDAGINPESLQGSATGVFVGMEESQYGLIAGNQGMASSGNAMISSRLSYHYDFHGPALTTNTACSSGLVALHQSVMSLRRGECDAAIAAGIALLLVPMSYVAMSQAGMLSPDGVSYSMSNNANGLGIGEAIAVVMLKPLSKACEDGNTIYGTVKGCGINFDGKTNGITAPNGRMQAALLERIYKENGIDVMDINHIVAHSNGTKLGDSVEINAINGVFKKLGNSSNADRMSSAWCAITSCKSNFGHTLAASGLVSLISLLKGLQHKTIPASLYCEEENDFIIGTNNPLYINKEKREWIRKNDKARLGAINAFGRSGTNAHVVVEEYVSSDYDLNTDGLPQSSSEVIIPLSARNSGQLRRKVDELFAYLDNAVLDEENGGASKQGLLECIAYTLQTGREEMIERIAFIAETIPCLLKKINNYRSNEPSSNAYFRGNAAARNNRLDLLDSDDEILKTVVEKLVDGKKYARIAELWVNGIRFDWRLLYGIKTPKRVHVPGYPFAEEQYWAVKNDMAETVKPSQNEYMHNTFGQSKPLAVHKLEKESPPQAIYYFTNNSKDCKSDVTLPPNEKIELFLKHEIARNLHEADCTIEVSKTFTELGANSYVIINLIDKLNDLLGLQLSPSIVFNYGSIAALSEYLRTVCPEKIDKLTVIKKNDGNGGNEMEMQSVACGKMKGNRESARIESSGRSNSKIGSGILVPMKDEGQEAPIIAVPGGDGNVISLLHFAEHLGEKRPFFGLEGVGI
ncbi:MAG: hypothetical protein GF344_03955, partial [Chitinivibrionales bacterium]|nr:hypothetical protein [Chitinivibrionales bacterium]